MIGLYTNQIEWLKSGDSQTKVAAFLLNMAKNFSHKAALSNSLLLDIQLTHQMIAEHTGLTRETVSLHLAKLRKEGIVEYHDGHIAVITLAGLTNIVEDII